MRIRILLLLAFTISLLTLKAQDYKVISVEPLPLDMTARDYIKQDERGRQCAVFRIVTQNIAPELREGFHFECDWNSFVVAHTLREGEIWVWVSPGIKTLKIKHEKLGPWDLHLTQYLPKVESLFTYRIVLQGTTNDNEDVAQQYLTFQITPTNAMLEVDGEIWPVTWDGTARKRVKEGTYSYLVQAPNYESAKGEVSVEDTAVVVRVSLKTIPLVNKKTNRWETFITLNGSYAPFSMGFSVGMVKRYGWFVSVMTNGSFTGMSNLPQADAQGFLDDGHLPMYNGMKATDRLSIIAGGMMRVVEPIYVRVGVGYGVRDLCWQDNQQQWYKIKGYSFQGVDVSAGVHAHLGGFVLSMEAVTTNFQTVEGKVGVGYAF
jgi:hypothetical protein